MTVQAKSTIVVQIGENGVHVGMCACDIVVGLKKKVILQATKTVSNLIHRPGQGDYYSPATAHINTHTGFY